MCNFKQHKEYFTYLYANAIITHIYRGDDVCRRVCANFPFPRACSIYVGNFKSCGKENYRSKEDTFKKNVNCEKCHFHFNKK